MKKSKFTEQQIAFILKQADDGVSVEDTCPKAGISIQTYYRWRQKYGGLMPSEMKRLRQLAQFRRSRAPIPDDPEQSHVRSSRAAHEGTIGCVSVSVNFLGVSQDRDHPSP